VVSLSLGYPVTSRPGSPGSPRTRRSPRPRCRRWRRCRTPPAGSWIWPRSGWGGLDRPAGPVPALGQGDVGAHAVAVVPDGGARAAWRRASRSARSPPAPAGPRRRSAGRSPGTAAASATARSAPTSGPGSVPGGRAPRQWSRIVSEAYRASCRPSGEPDPHARRLDVCIGFDPAEKATATSRRRMPSVTRGTSGWASASDFGGSSAEANAAHGPEDRPVRFSVRQCRVREYPHAPGCRGHSPDRWCA
jgi:hypothetical protein